MYKLLAAKRCWLLSLCLQFLTPGHQSALLVVLFIRRELKVSEVQNSPGIKGISRKFSILLLGAVFIGSCAIAYPYVKKVSDKLFWEINAERLDKEINELEANRDSLEVYKLAMEKAKNDWIDNLLLESPDPYFGRRQHDKLTSMPGYSLAPYVIIAGPGTTPEEILRQDVEFDNFIDGKIELATLNLQNLRAESLRIQGNLIGALSVFSLFDFLSYGREEGEGSGFSSLTADQVGLLESHHAGTQQRIMDIDEAITWLEKKKLQDPAGAEAALEKCFRAAEDISVSLNCMYRILGD